jgi:alpha-beta hydrolase superfamily lysophospholipase
MAAPRPEATPGVTPAAWIPEGFDAVRDWFPATPAFALPGRGAPGLDLSPRFAEAWWALEPAAWAALPAALDGLADAAFVLVRGYLGHYMPGNLTSVRGALRGLGVDARIAPNRAGGTIADNARRLVAAVEARVPRGRPLVWLGHSRGGLEALLALAQAPALAARTRLVVLSQTPRGPSYVLESVLLGRHAASRPLQRALAEQVQRAGLQAIGAARGGRELTRDALPELLARVDAAPRPFPVVTTASWSSRPTTWLDSFHARLGEIRPGVAHDGQFYLEDLLWPGLPHVYLPHVDHAQPVMEGFGFDPARYWLATLAAAWALGR